MQQKARSSRPLEVVGGKKTINFLPPALRRFPREVFSRGSRSRHILCHKPDSPNLLEGTNSPHALWPPYPPPFGPASPHMLSRPPDASPSPSHSPTATARLQMWKRISESHLLPVSQPAKVRLKKVDSFPPGAAPRRAQPNANQIANLAMVHEEPFVLPEAKSRNQYSGLGQSRVCVRSGRTSDFLKRDSDVFASQETQQVRFLMPKEFARPQPMPPSSMRVTSRGGLNQTGYFKLVGNTIRRQRQKVPSRTPRLASPPAPTHPRRRIKRRRRRLVLAHDVASGPETPLETAFATPPMQEIRDSTHSGECGLRFMYTSVQSHAKPEDEDLCNITFGEQQFRTLFTDS